MGPQGESTVPGGRGHVLDDRYELGELIGVGGMAEVWRARDRRLGRDVALKLLSGAAARDPSRRGRIEREARALAAANHPNIVAVYDYGEAPGSDDEILPYVVMELVDGPDLHHYLAERGPLPVEETQRILRGVLDGVERAHASGVVHGDLKPGNVFIGPHGPKVGDFGVARILGQETGTTTVAATPTFAAPEVLKGERATASSDVYSASCLAFELLAGRPPFEGANAWEVAQKHLETAPPKLRSFRSDVPPELEAAIQRGMEKSPRRRFPTAAAFGAAIGDATGAGRASAASATVPVADSGATVPVAGSRSSGPQPTETIGTRPNLSRAAVFGPFALLWDKLSMGRRRLGSNLRDRSRVRWLVAASVALLLLLGFLALRDPGPKPVAVPDLTGKTVQEASGLLRTQGFKSDVSYRPVTEGKPYVVLDTIPAAEALVEPGTKVHLIASALAATPQPTISPDEGGGGGEGRGKDEEGRGESNGNKNDRRGREEDD